MVCWKFRIMLIVAIGVINNFCDAEINWLDQNQKMIRLVKAGKALKALENGSTLLQDIRDKFLVSKKVSADAVVFLVNQGIICKQNGFYQAAREALELAAECKIRIASPNDPLFVPIYKALGETLQELKIFDESEKAFLKALEIKEINFGRDHPECIPLYFSLADCYQAASRQEDALKILQKTLSISRIKNGEQSSRTAEVYFYLGEYFYKIQKNPEAEDHFLLAAGIYDRNRDIKKLTCVYDYLGSMNKVKGDLKDAEYYYSLSVKSGEMTGKKNSIEYAKSLNNLASIYLLQKNREAEKLLRQSLIIFESLLGQNDPSLAPVLNNLILYYTQINNSGELTYYKNRFRFLEI